jgi:energy-coupling factor transporter transmembrane protein EcfT
MSFFSTLTYSEFIDALTKLRIPSVLVGSLIIMLHYIPILAGSNKKILEAQEMRGKKITSYWQKLKTHAYIMGKTIVMNMERSEKLYESLKMRGFSGKITFATKKIKIIDVGLLIFFSLLIIYFVFIIDLKSIYCGVLTLILP